MVFCLSLLAGSTSWAGVGKEVQQEYRQQYENRALFLRRPVRGDRDTVHLRGNLVVDDPGNLNSPLTFKVGEQIRIMAIDFNDSSIEFKLAAVDQSRRATLIFEFGESLSYTFHLRPAFEAALKETLSEGLSYKELDSAKEKYVTDQYNRTVRQFSETTGASADFVNKAILESQPEYARIQKELDQARQRLSQAESSLAEERSARKNIELQLQEVRSGLAGASESASTLRRERDDLQRERNQLDQELTRVKTENAKFREQVQAVASKLNVQVDSNSQLGRQVDGLSRNIDTLTQDRARLSGQVADLDRKFTELTKDRDRLGQELSDSRRRAEKLQGDLKALTSDRGSLESTYLNTKESKEKLETAARLEEALTVTRNFQAGSDRLVQVGEINLLSQPVGTVELIPSSSPDQPTILRLKTASPNTVQFTEEERRLYQALGGVLKMEAALRSSSSSIQSSLAAGESVQSAAPREEAEWQWNLEGSPREGDVMSLDLHIIDENGLKVPLAGYYFQVQSAGLLSSLGGSFSWGSLLVGLLAGVALAGLGVVFRDRSSPRQNGIRTRTVAGEKQL
jgi:predicted  nucleic acid-binding Zn-ribbon protein